VCDAHRRQAKVLEELDSLEKAFRERLGSADSAGALEQLRVEFLGRKGKLAEIMKRLAGVAPAERPGVGKRANEIKQWLETVVRERAVSLTAAPSAARSTFDPTLPGVRPRLGRRHLIQSTIEEMVDIFQRLGFDVAYGPEVEDSWHNFEALNIPADHPAADPNNSFFIDDKTILRTQTSPMQVPPVGGTDGGRGRHVRSPEGGAADFRAGVFLARDADPPASALFPIHGAERRA
jgi:phenylalanyl-tRNA synthetase alpha chain